MSSVRLLEPPTLSPTSLETLGLATAQIDAEWDFADEPAATDGALMGKPDAPLGFFPSGPSDAAIAALIDACADELCRPTPPRRRLSRARGAARRRR